MGDGDDGARVVLEEALQPGDRLGVEMVGRLVEQQQVRRLQQQPAQRDAAALAARELGDVGVRRRQAQRVHGELELRVEIPRVGGVDLVLQPRLLVEDLVHFVGRQVLAELRVHVVVALEQRLGRRRRLLPRCRGRSWRDRAAVPAAGSRPMTPSAGERFADEALVLAGHDPQQRGLAGAVEAEHADLGAG